MDFPSLPSTRSATPSLAHQYSTSPTGSVQSLPHYPTYCSDDFTGFSDSSNNSSLLDLTFDNPTANSDFDDDEIVTFSLDPFVPNLESYVPGLDPFAPAGHS